MNNIYPLISVALCTYNGETYLRKQLDTLVLQTYPNLEIIALDDQSKDGTFKILKEYEEKYSFFKAIINDQNLGFVKNFEKAIKLCAGDFIAISDQDDLWELNKIEVLYKEIGDNMLIYHDSHLIDSNDKKLGNQKMSTETRIHSGNCNLYFLTKNSVSGHASLFRKELKEYIFPFDERFYYDWWIAYVAASVGKIKYISNILVHYRKHAVNVTNSLPSAEERQKSLPGNKYFTYDLEWIKYLAQFKYAKNARLIGKIYNILSNYSRGKKGVPFFLFLLEYNSILFYLDRKSFFSELNHVRKIYSSEINQINSL